MEPALRLAERKYQETGTWEDLTRYNALRRRSGLDLIHPEGELEYWAEHLASLIPPTGACKQEIEEGHTPFGATEHFFGALTKDNILIDIEIDPVLIVEEYFTISYICPSREGILLNAPRCLLDLRVDANEVEILRNLPWHSSSIYGLRSQTIPNNFINVEEVFEYGLRRVLRCAKRLIPWTTAKLRKEKNSRNLTEYLVASLALGKDLLEKRDPLLEETFKSKWFQNILYLFARELEEYVEANGIVFDNEGGWPIKISPYGGYSVSVKPGYNDTIDPDTDEEIDSNIRGEQRGYAYDVLDKLSDILNDYDGEHTTPLHDLESDEGWEGDSYDLYEAPEEGEVDISFDLEVTRELTVPFVLHLLRSFD